MANKLMVNRLLVLLQVILIPAYFLILSWTDMINIDLGRILRRDPLEGHPGLEFFLMSIVLPLVFALPWVLPALMNPNKLADAYELMGRTLGKIRGDLKLFYGLNAAFLMIFFILPFASPILSIGGTISLFSVWIYKKSGGHVPKGLLVLVGVILAIFPSIAAIAFYMDYSILWNTFAGWWGEELPLLYSIAICVADAIVFGDLVFLLRGKTMTNSTLRREYAAGKDIPVKALFFGVMIFLLAVTYQDGNSSTVNVINLFAIVGSALAGFIKWRRKLGEGGAGGLFIMFIFMIVNTIRTYFHNAMVVVIVLSGAIFIGLFALAYSAAQDERYIQH